jgi:hypothetical protein
MEVFWPELAKRRKVSRVMVKAQLATQSASSPPLSLQERDRPCRKQKSEQTSNHKQPISTFTKNAYPQTADLCDSIEVLLEISPLLFGYFSALYPGSFRRRNCGHPTN